MPALSTPRMFVGLISIPPTSFAPSSATGTSAPSNTFVAPVTMQSGASPPTSMEQICNLSAFGCFSSALIRPTTTPETLGISSKISATSNPRHIMRSTNSSGVTFHST